MSDTSTTMLFLRMGFSLAVILGLIWLAARLLRRSGKKAGTSSAALDVVARRSMGRRSSLLVIDVSGRRLLVGATDTQISLVADLTGDIAGDVNLGRLELAPLDDRDVEVLNLTTPAVARTITTAPRTGGRAGATTGPAGVGSLINSIRDLTVRRS